jgi:hypothetical protein
MRKKNPIKELRKAQDANIRLTEATNLHLICRKADLIRLLLHSAKSPSSGT